MKAFFGKEVLEAAVQIERNGQAFYEQVSQKSEDEGVREVFSDLAVEEKRHISQFQGLSDCLVDPPDSMEREDYALYLDHMTAEHVFKEDGSGERKARETKSAVEAVELGIQFEKDTLLFFHELRPLVRSEEQGVVDQLILWEKEHLVRLVGLKRQLSGRSRDV